MANNRLYLVDKETGIHIMLCKSLGSGPYMIADTKLMQVFFDRISIDDDNLERVITVTEDSMDYNNLDGSLFISRMDI